MKRHPTANQPTNKHSIWTAIQTPVWTTIGLIEFKLAIVKLFHDFTRVDKYSQYPSNKSLPDQHKRQQHTSVSISSDQFTTPNVPHNGQLSKRQHQRRGALISKVCHTFHNSFPHYFRKQQRAPAQIPKSIQTARHQISNQYERTKQSKAFRSIWTIVTLSRFSHSHNHLSGTPANINPSRRRCCPTGTGHLQDSWQSSAPYLIHLSNNHTP